MNQTDEIEMGFIARALIRLGGEPLVKTYVEAKSLGVCDKMFSNPSCRVTWMAAEELFGGPHAENVNVTSIAIRAKQIAKATKDRELSGANPDDDFREKAKSFVRMDDTLTGFYSRLRDAYVAREMEAIYRKAKDSIDAGVDSLTAVSQMQVGCDDLIKGTQTNRDGPDIEKIYNEARKDFMDAFHHKQELGELDYVAGLATPWKELTDILGGIGNVMMIVAARTGVGKTSFAVSLIRYWLRTGKHVLFDSLDMESREMALRQFSEGSGVPIKMLKNGDITADRFQSCMQRFDEAGAELIGYQKSGHYKMLEEYDVDVLASKAKILKDQGKLDVLVIDYIQLLETKRGGSEYEKLTNVTKRVRRIANEVKVPVVALAQINRAPAKEGAEPELHDLKGTGEIEQDAAIILILDRNKKLSTEWESNPPMQYARDQRFPKSASSMMPMWVKIAKSRDAKPNSRIPFVVNQSRYSWYVGDTKAEGDEMFARVHLNHWKSDSIEKFWKDNGAVIDEDLQHQIDIINERNKG